MPFAYTRLCLRRLFDFRRLISTTASVFHHTSTKQPISSKSRCATPMSAAKLPLHFGGQVQNGFEYVEQVFKQNFRDGWEAAGAAFAVYRNGQLIIDLWGGYSNTENQEAWQQNTMNILFSTTKSVTALLFAKLIDRGLASYDDLVTKYWPEYGQYGKADTTISMVLLHQAGLPFLDREFGAAELNCAENMSKLVESQSPVWIPGTKSGYHTLTIGIIIDQLARRIDPDGQSIAQVLREEIKTKYGVDEIYLGLPRNMNSRVSTLQLYNNDDLLRESAENKSVMEHYLLGQNEYHDKMRANTPWLWALDYNQPFVREMEIPAANGIATARALAKVHSLVAEGSFLSSKTLAMLYKPQLIDELDVVNGYPECKGHGFQYTKNPQESWIFGHSGLGGQNVRIDLDNKLAFAYLCNGLKAGDSDNTGTFSRLKSALYDCLDLDMG